MYKTHQVQSVVYDSPKKNVVYDLWKYYPKIRKFTYPKTLVIFIWMKHVTTEVNASECI